MKRWIPNLHSLSAQLILSFVALVLLTAAAAGAPAIWLIHDQLERQARAQVKQGSLVAQALYEARQNELQNLATLTAQRPTLRELLAKGAAQAGEAVPGGLCRQGPHSGFHIVPPEWIPRAWLLAAHTIDGEAGDSLGTVFVGVALNDKFAVQMRAQTGLEHTLLVDGQPVATSLTARQGMSCAPLNGRGQNTFWIAGRPYYANCLLLDGGGLQAEMALDVTEVAATLPRLIGILVSSILAGAALASLLGIFMARRIGRPLAHLAKAADAMSQGDLDTPLAVEARVREVTLLAQALEGARDDLKRTLTELGQEKAWTDHLLEAIVEGIVTLDRKGRITFFSRGAEQITVAVALRDGREAILAVTGARLLPPDGEEARVALVFRDVSDAEAVHRLLGHFLANVAHEFRTPLSALAASVELLLDQAPDLTAAELEELLTSLYLGVLGLQTLIDNLLESASIEAGHFRVHPRPSNLGEIIAAAIHTMQPLLDKHGQRLVVELPVAIPMVRADPRRVTQVLVNLLSNANKYSPDEAKIEVAAAVRGEWVRVTVTDSGSGVPPSFRKDLFRRFVHPDVGNAHGQVGAGLGLSVVKAIVDAHGGNVGVDDHPDGGSIFWFTLPRVSEP